jgi:hypothetical protein
MKEKGREIRSPVRHINCRARSGKKNSRSSSTLPKFRPPLPPLRSVALKVGCDPHSVHVLSFSLNLSVCLANLNRRSSSVISPLRNLIPVQSKWDLLRTGYYWDRLFSKYSGFPLSVSFHQYPIHTHLSITDAVQS